MSDAKPPDRGGEGRGADAAPSSDESGLAPWTEQRLLRRTLEARLKVASDSDARKQLEDYAKNATESEKRKALSTLLVDDERAVKDALDYVKAAQLDEGRLDKGTQIIINIGVPGLARPPAKPPPLDVPTLPATNGKPAA